MASTNPNEDFAELLRLFSRIEITMKGFVEELRASSRVRKADVSTSVYGGGSKGLARPGFSWYIDAEIGGAPRCWTMDLAWQDGAWAISRDITVPGRYGPESVATSEPRRAESLGECMAILNEEVVRLRESLDSLFQ